MTTAETYRLARKIFDGEMEYREYLKSLGHGNHIQCNCDTRSQHGVTESWRMIDWAQFRLGRAPCGPLPRGHAYYHNAPKSSPCSTSTPTPPAGCSSAATGRSPAKRKRRKPNGEAQGRRV